MKRPSSKTSDTDMAKKMKQSKVLVFPGLNGDFVIDEEDCFALSEIRMRDATTGMLDLEATCRMNVCVEENSKRRIRKYQACAYSPMVSLPPSIGRMSQLTHLSLSSCETLSLLPPSIGRLKNLKELNLSYTDSLSVIPEEVGDLTSLEILDLHWSNVTSLPASIEQLRALKELHLAYTNLLELPEEIGGLINLETLVLIQSSIVSLPSSIGGLRKVKKLLLSQAKRLSELPEEIGELTDLQTLFLYGSGVRKLPNSFGKLKGLMHLHVALHKSCVLDGQEDQDGVSMTMAKQFKWLGDLFESGSKQADYIMACNRSRYRTMSMELKMLPLVLHEASRAFARYDAIECRHFDPHVPDEYYIDKADAIYQLLWDGRESFIWAILERNFKASAASSAA